MGMRFIEKGPLIPDELLIARDQGRVVFFCGAGVSYAQAGLPNFYDLALKVCQKLKLQENDPAQKILCNIQQIDAIIGTPGIVSMDKVFGLLERDFDSKTLNAVVADSLRPSKKVNLSAHRILIDLATTPEGRLQLVTTNFDRLFSDSKPEAKILLPNDIANWQNSNTLDGIVYLHGRATPSYNGAELNNFVLSSSSFGRAYISEGWATNFFIEILRRYLVVFIGYTADDPPVSYLLEALRSHPGGLNNIYSFQSGTDDDAAAKWRHKGVTSIAYDGSNKHSALWTTLEKWAERAQKKRRLVLWYHQKISRRASGPIALRARSNCPHNLNHRRCKEICGAYSTSSCGMALHI